MKNWIQDHYWQAWYNVAKVPLQELRRIILAAWEAVPDSYIQFEHPGQEGDVAVHSPLQEGPPIGQALRSRALNREATLCVGPAAAFGAERAP